MEIPYKRIGRLFSGKNDPRPQGGLVGLIDMYPFVRDFNSRNPRLVINFSEEDGKLIVTQRFKLDPSFKDGKKENS